MTTVGQLLLLAAFVGSGYACFASIAGWVARRPGVVFTGLLAGWSALLAATGVSIILAVALISHDLRFAYVATYADRVLPWHYSLSAFWVGQAGSILLWSWLALLVALVYRHWPRSDRCELRGPAFGLLMAVACLLAAIMVFAADPMAPCLAAPANGGGLSPLLQHPVMLVHPPIVFLGYALWGVPFALAATALFTGRLDAAWIREARPWSLLAWSVLGAGILLGAKWAYEELGWGGYWAWDPVENGSFLPWLTGTALVHMSMVWWHLGALKKTTLSLAILTFALCLFATYVTRSGIYSSLHAFSQSPLGWAFLVGVFVILAGGTGLMIARRTQLVPEHPIASLWTREAVIVLAAVAILALAAVTTAGTVSAPLSQWLLGRQLTVGPAYYSNVLIPTGIILLATTAMAPLLRWGKSSRPAERKRIAASFLVGLAAPLAGFALGVRNPILLVVVWLAAAALLALAASLQARARRSHDSPLPARLFATLWADRREYSAYVIHAGFLCLALGISGSALGGRRFETSLHDGETVHWCGYSIRLCDVTQRREAGKRIVEAHLRFIAPRADSFWLKPAQHYHLRQDEWTTEMAVRSTWQNDFCAILIGADADERVEFVLVRNPMMRWLWVSGLVAMTGVVLNFASQIRLGKARRQKPEPATDLPHATVPAPHSKPARMGRRETVRRV